MNDYFKFFANCLFVKGVNRVLVHDLQRHTYDILPIDIWDVYELLKNKTSIIDLIKLFGNENEEAIIEYIDYFLENEYGFYCDESEFERFPELSLKYDTPSKITNTIIEIKKEDIGLLEELIKDIENLGCKDVLLLIYDQLSIEDFKNILFVFNNTIIKSLSITSSFYSSINTTFLKTINSFENRLTSLIFYSANKNETNLWNNNILFDVIYSKKSINSMLSCGKVKFDYFKPNLLSVLESINHNSCLNNKISIDINGNIKNCPAMPQSFGNIMDTSLEQALNHKDFKKYWNITKDHVDVCKDCEFRYVCTDCRAYLENPKDIHSKPLKCGYSPYTNEWEEWSSNPLKQKVIEYYGMQELVKKDNEV